VDNNAPKNSKPTAFTNTSTYMDSFDELIRGNFDIYTQINPGEIGTLHINYSNYTFVSPHILSRNTYDHV